MSHGLMFTNNSDVVVLDSEFSRLVILYSGRYSSGASFPYPITSAEAPLIFVRPDNSQSFQWIRLNGGPGNWTGWSNTGFGGGAGSYFIAAYQSTPTAEYGLRLWDGNSKLLFDNGTACAQFTNVITGWSFLGSSNPSVGRWEFRWNAGVPLNTGNYMLINNIAMDIPGRDTFSKLSCTWDYGSNSIMVLLQNIGDFNAGALFLPLMFSKPTS
jgi:hypothetical protein